MGVIPPWPPGEWHSHTPKGASPPLTPNYFLLLALWNNYHFNILNSTGRAQKKVIKEKGTTNDKFCICLPTCPR